MNENVPSVVDSDELILLEEVFKLRPDIRVVVSTMIWGRKNERAIKSR